MITPNMNLTVPTVGTTPGPTYALNVDNSFTLIDQHDHSAGRGVLITPSGLSISADLSFQNNNAIGLRSVVLNLNSTTLSSPIDIGNVYRVNGDLWYNNGGGTPVQITNGNNVAGTPGSISGLVSPASASYSGLTDTFTWQSNANTPANMNFGSATFGNINSSGNGVTVSPVSLSGSYSLILPTLPVSKKILTLDSSGNIVASYDVDNSTLTIISNIIQVKALGITDAQIATGTITTDKFATNVTPTHQVFTSSGTFTVPAGVNIITWTLIGAGGGGGGGAARNGGGAGGGGGGGGAAGQVYTQTVTTTPSTVWTVTVGSSGGGGSGGNPGGGTGGTGGNSSVTDSITTIAAGGGQGGQGGFIFSAPGQTGGNGGAVLQWSTGFTGPTGGASASGVAGGNGADAFFGGIFGHGGGGGGATNSGSPAGSGGASGSVSGGAGGGSTLSGGGGGAGGSLYKFNTGGTGGTGGTNGGGGPSGGGSGSDIGSGGGGGGGGSVSTANGASGGAGFMGAVIVFYQVST